MRAKSVISIVCFSALSLVLCSGAGLQAQSTPPPSPSAGASTQDSANDLSVAVGKSVLVDVAWPIRRVANNMADIADVHATSPNEIMVSGKAPGETSLIIWDTHGGRQFFNVTVRPSASALNDNLEAIRRELRAELPGQSLKVSSENGSIYLRGTVKNLASSSRAVKIASAGLASKDGKVVNLLDVEVPASEPQILLKVRFASVDLDKAKSLGINLGTMLLGNTTGMISTGQFTTPNITASPIGNLPISVGLEALESRGVTEILAEPNIVAANGKQASFLAGGEYPYPMAQASGTGAPTITIMFKEYGVRLNFIPTITPRGTIRLQVAPEVSALDFPDAVDIDGTEVPAITTRKMKTEVELADGQSFVIGGLLDNRETETFMKIPFLGSIPILGKFFQSMTRDKKKTELIVIVTPEIVAPIEAGAPLPELKYPVKFLPPNSGIPMNNPDAKTAANTPASAPPTMPVEKLKESMKPETPLVIEGAAGGFGGASNSAPAPSTSESSESQ